MNEKRGNLYLVTGLIIGLLIGFLFSMMFPVRYVDTDPSLLQSGDKDLYRSLIARAYLLEVDNNRAKARLDLLKDVNPEDALVAQAQQLLAAGGNEAESRALAILADALSHNTVQITPLPQVISRTTVEPVEPAPPVATMAETSEPAFTPTPMVVTTLAATMTSLSTDTPVPTESAPYTLLTQKEVCNSALAGSLIQVYVFDPADKPVPGVRIEVSITDGGMESFYTGLNPVVSAGYADYQMTEGMTYNLRVGEAGQLVQNLSIPRCVGNDGNSYPGSIELIFKRYQ